MDVTDLKVVLTKDMVHPIDTTSVKAGTIGYIVSLEWDYRVTKEYRVTVKFPNGANWIMSLDHIEILPTPNGITVDDWNDASMDVYDTL